MAEGKKAKTAEKGGDAARKRLCPSCGAESRVVQLAGFGPRGSYWVCDQNCGSSERTRWGPLGPLGRHNPAMARARASDSSGSGTSKALSSRDGDEQHAA